MANEPNSIQLPRVPKLNGLPEADAIKLHRDLVLIIKMRHGLQASDAQIKDGYTRISESIELLSRVKSEGF